MFSKRDLLKSGAGLALASALAPGRADQNGLQVTVPDGASHAYGVALKINGEGLV